MQECLPYANVGRCWSGVVPDCYMVDGLACSNTPSTRHWPAAWTTVCLCENWWATLGTFALIIWTVLLHITVNATWLLSDVAVGLLYGDSTFDVALLTVLYVIKSIVSFYKVQDEHMKRGVVGFVCVICFTFPQVCFCQELAKLDDIWPSCDKYKKSDVFSDTQCISCQFVQEHALKCYARSLL